ncbi:MAG: M48 family metallopeptidase, partial [Candidatus Rokuibacteriota bacterium]
AKYRRLTWLLMAVFTRFLGFLGFGFDLVALGYDPARPLARGQVPIPIGASFAVLLGGASSWLSYRWGDRAVLAASMARPVTADDPNAKVLMNVVTEMAIASGQPMPKVYVIDDPDPNAFATGRSPEHASIAVTSGLLTVMSRDELQGVVAHEMSHVRNYDIRTMTIVAALLGAVLLLSDWAARLRLRGGKRSRDDDRGGGLPGPLMLVVFVVWLLAIVLAPIIGQILATAVSRYREYLADASGAELTRNPMGLAGALRKLHAATAPTARIARGTAHLCITDPLERRVNERRGALADLLATHPPIEDRIARLEQMAYRA